MSALRLATLVNTGSKMLAVVAGEPPASTAGGVVHPAQRVFLAGWEMGDNIIEVEGSL